jgi:hypothetical protein
MEHPTLLDPMALLKSEASYKEPRIGRLIKLKPPQRIKSSYEDASTLVIPTVKNELVPEEIPLPSSPIPESPSFRGFSNFQWTQQAPV